MKGKSKQQKGITLIALIITIVVLLILAIVAINAIQDTDIIGQTENSANTYNESVENEQKELGSYTDILKDYEYQYTGAPFPEYKIGDEVTIGTESFYVIKDSGKTESKVLLLAKGNINTTTLVQDGNDNYVAFSTENYWEEGEPPRAGDIKEETFPIPESHTAAKAAYDYGVKVGGAGRLMTYAEADALRNNTTFSSKLYETNFWVGYAIPYNSVMYFDKSDFNQDYYGLEYFGVRPVVEISKSKVTQ